MEENPISAVICWRLWWLVEDTGTYVERDKPARSVMMWSGVETVVDVLREHARQ